MNRHSSANRGPDASADVVAVARYGQDLSVTPSCPEIERIFGTEARRPVEDDQHGCRIVTRVEPLLAPVQPPQPLLPGQRLPIATAGLEPIAAYKAEKAGYKVERRWYSPPPSPLPEPNLEASRWLGGCDEHVLRFVHDHERGLIRHVPGNVDLIRLIIQIALAYPEATMVVTMATNKTARKVYGRLRKWLPNVSMSTAKYCPPAPGRIVVATFTALAHSEIECEKRSIVIAMDAAELIGERGQEAMLMADARFKLFGFLPVDRKLSSYDYDRMIAMFGLNEVVVPRHGYQPIRVNVAWTPIHAPALPEGIGLLTLKRRGIWKQHQRNRQIARLAKAIYENDQSFLAERHGSIARALDFEETPQVMVLVESVDHGLSLADRLKNLPLITGPEVITDGLSPEHQRRLEQQRRQWPVEPPFIVTASGLDHQVRACRFFFRTATGVSALVTDVAEPTIPQVTTMCRHITHPRPATGRALFVARNLRACRIGASIRL